MDAKDVKTVEDAKKIVADRDIRYVKVGVFDVDGVMRGKYVSRDKFLSALDKGFGFCDVVLGWDTHDQTYDSAAFTGWHTAFPDAPARIYPETCRELPFEDNTLLFIAELQGAAGEICPRALLRRILQRAGDMGFSATAACEFEFFVFEETPHSVREKGYRNLRNISPGFFGYSVLRSSVFSEFHHELLRTCAGCHAATGAQIPH